MLCSATVEVESDTYRKFIYAPKKITMRVNSNFNDATYVSVSVTTSTRLAVQLLAMTTLTMEWIACFDQLYICGCVCEKMNDAVFELVISLISCAIMFLLLDYFFFRLVCRFLWHCAVDGAGKTRQIGFMGWQSFPIIHLPWPKCSIFTSLSVVVSQLTTWHSLFCDSTSCQVSRYWSEQVLCWLYGTKLYLSYRFDKFFTFSALELLKNTP